MSTRRAPDISFSTCLASVTSVSIYVGYFFCNFNADKHFFVVVFFNICSKDKFTQTRNRNQYKPPVLLGMDFLSEWADHNPHEALFILLRLLSRIISVNVNRAIFFLCFPDRYVGKVACRQQSSYCWCFDIFASSTTFDKCKSDAKRSSRHIMKHSCWSRISNCGSPTSKTHNDGVTPHVLQAVTVNLRNGKIHFSSSSNGGSTSSNSGILEAPTGLCMLNTGVVMF